jgi:hypothetical protein
LVLVGHGMAKRLRNKDFPIPKRIRDADWEALCESIPNGHQQRLRMRLDEMVDRLVMWMRYERKSPDRKSDREKVKDVLSHVNQAADIVNRLGPSGHLALKAISPLLASMLTAQWMNESFPDDDYTPQRSSVPKESAGLRAPLRMPIRAPRYFIEEHSHEARYQFVRQSPVKTTGTALKQMAAGLNEVLRAFDLQPRARGGQQPLIYRHYAICHLIAMWDEMGKEPSSTPKSDFAAFCEAVAGYIGWPSEGVSSAIPDAMKHWRGESGEYWRHLPRKINR